MKILRLLITPRDNIEETFDKNENSEYEISSGALIREAYRDRDRMNINFNGSDYSSQGHRRDENDIFKYVVHEYGGVKSETIDRLYSVKIYVYQAGAAENNFPADKLITTYDGTATQ